MTDVVLKRPRLESEPPAWSEEETRPNKPVNPEPVTDDPRPEQEPITEGEGQPAPDGPPRPQNPFQPEVPNIQPQINR